MVVKSKISKPVKRKDGTWTTVIEEFYEDIPDLGRHCLICNRCGFKAYPACMEWCPVEQNRRERLEKEGAKQAEK